MTTILKKIYFFILGLVQTIVSILLIIVFNRPGSTCQLRRIKKQQKGNTASILASGPSAREIVEKRKDLLLETDILVLNNFANQEVFFQLKPKYYIIVDPAYFDDNFIYEGLAEKSGNTDRTQEKMVIENLKKVDWPMTLFLPSNRKARKAKHLFLENPKIKTVFFNATKVVGFTRFQNLMYGLGQGVPSSRNVIIPAMILLIICGYKKVLLYGCEFSWTKTMDVDLENGMMFFNDRHFYSKDEIRYFGKGAYLWWLEGIVECLKATNSVACFAESKGIQITNRTKGSFIDSFVYENPDNLPQGS